jgi:CubicO group peptidase (beta-lactamase class C family)
MNLEAAETYARRHTLEALIVERAGKVLLERYAGGFDREKPHALYSGTKSFWGAVAVIARDEGLLELDEPVSKTLGEWKDGVRTRVTLRQLLNLTSGIGFGGLGNAVPTVDRAIATQLKDEPGKTFTYGGIPLQVFGAVFARKAGRSPQAYLTEKLLDPIGLHVASWRTLKDGTQPLPTGAQLGAGEWLKYGRYIVDNAERFAECFTGSKPNPRYGLGFWLSPIAARPALVYASGARGQALYIDPPSKTVVVKFGDSASYNHETFLTRLAL